MNKVFVDDASFLHTSISTGEQAFISVIVPMYQKN